VNNADVTYEEQHLRLGIGGQRTVETMLRPPGISLGRGESCAGWTLAWARFGHVSTAIIANSVGAIGSPGIFGLLRSAIALGHRAGATLAATADERALDPARVAEHCVWSAC
jgi:hypothetical protein